MGRIWGRGGGEGDTASEPTYRPSRAIATTTHMYRTHTNTSTHTRTQTFNFENLAHVANGPRRRCERGPICPKPRALRSLPARTHAPHKRDPKNIIKFKKGSGSRLSDKFATRAGPHGPHTCAVVGAAPTHHHARRRTLAQPQSALHWPLQLKREYQEKGVRQTGPKRRTRSTA